jgi:hypothetical protein
MFYIAPTVLGAVIASTSRTPPDRNRNRYRYRTRRRRVKPGERRENTVWSFALPIQSVVGVALGTFYVPRDTRSLRLPPPALRFALCPQRSALSTCCSALGAFFGGGPPGL